MTYQHYGTYSFAAVAPTKTISWQQDDATTQLVVPDFPLDGTGEMSQLKYTFNVDVELTPGTYTDVFTQACRKYAVQVYVNSGRSFMIIVDDACIVAYFSIPVDVTDTWADNLLVQWSPHMTLCAVPAYLDGILQ